MIKLKQLSNLVSNPDKNGRVKLIKKNIITDLYIPNPFNITLVEQTYDKKGRISKNICNIKIDGEYKVVKHSPDYIASLIEPKAQNIGFNNK